MPTVDSPFVESVLRHFAFLQERYAFQVTEAAEHWVAFASRACRVMVALDRIDLYVDIASVETEPVRRVRFPLGTLLAVKEAGEPVAAPADVDGRLRHAAELLARYGGDVLAGDWSIRPQIVRQQTWYWLEAQYRQIMGAPDPQARQARMSQLIVEYGGQNQEHRRATWQCLDEWLRGDDGQRRAFAELVVPVL